MIVLPVKIDTKRLVLMANHAASHVPLIMLWVPSLDKPPTQSTITGKKARIEIDLRSVETELARDMELPSEMEIADSKELD